MISRRDLLLGASAAAAQGAARRPNVLFIMVDEMRWDAMSGAGHGIVRTPNLDRLARQGMSFDNSYTVAPVCSPARASAFTGRYAHVHGVTSNAVPARDGEIFLPSILKHYGYHTAISGKLHYAPRHYGFGFDQFWSFSAEGPTPEKGYNEYMRRKHGSPAKWPIVPGTCPWPDDELGRDVGVFKHPEEDFETDWITARAVDYLQSRRGTNQPWFLFTSYLKPHSPSVEPEKYMRMYDPRAMPVPKLPPNAREIRAAQRGQSRRHYVDDPEMMCVLTAAYYGAITHVDDHVGKLLGELDRLGMSENTLVLFTADHGNMLGDRGRWFKGIMYEGSAHVPLIWRGPKGAQENRGHTERKIVENTDVMPSILESAGIPVPNGVQGSSFLKLAREGEDVRWKDRGYAQLATAMVRTPEWKFIDNSRDLSGSFELYDMRNDPKEERNLASEPRHRDLIREFGRQLTAWRAAQPAAPKIAGMDTPDYAQISQRERNEALENAPARRERRNGKR
jgi:arylsulfatase A-like enzyme